MRRLLITTVAALALTLPAAAQNNQTGGGGSSTPKMPPAVQGGGSGSASPADGGARVQGSAGNQDTMGAAGPDANTTPRQDMNRPANQDGTGDAGRTPDGQNQPGQQKADARQNAGKGDGQGKGRDINITENNRTVIKKNITRTRVNLPADVRISIGVRLPTTIAYLPVPEPIIAVIPELAPYQYVVVGDQIVFVDPATYEIVYVMAAA